MDLLRSCKTSQVRYVENDVLQVVPITWYFAKRGALVFPSWHSFTSETWDYSHPTFFDLGEVPFPRPRWSNGRRNNSSDGTTFAGPLAYFQTGAPAPGFLPRGVNDTPIDCMSPPFGKAGGGVALSVVSAQGGGLKGGVAIPAGPTPGIACVNCTGVTPANVTVTGGGFVGIYAVFNGTFIVPQILACNWFLNIGGGAVITITRNPGPSWHVSFSLFPTGTGFDLITADCVSSFVPALTSNTQGGAPTCFGMPGP